MITYLGRNRHGVAVTGARSESLRGFVKRCYDQGWQRLTVSQDGREVGWIRKLADGKRVWWYDDTQT